MRKGIIMACFAVFLKSTNKQIRVFAYKVTNVTDATRAYNLAFKFAMDNHKNGYPCIIEEYAFSSDIGVLVFDSEKAL